MCRRFGARCPIGANVGPLSAHRQGQSAGVVPPAGLPAVEETPRRPLATRAVPRESHHPHNQGRDDHCSHRLPPRHPDGTDCPQETIYGRCAAMEHRGRLCGDLCPGSPSRLQAAGAVGERALGHRRPLAPRPRSPPIPRTPWPRLMNPRLCKSPGRIDSDPAPSYAFWTPLLPTTDVKHILTIGLCEQTRAGDAPIM